MGFKRGIRTSEFWLTIVTFAIGLIAKFAGEEFPAEAFIAVAGYVISRGIAKFGK